MMLARVASTFRRSRTLAVSSRRFLTCSNHDRLKGLSVAGFSQLQHPINGLSPGIFRGGGGAKGGIINSVRFASSVALEDDDSSSDETEPTIEETYSRKSPLEHVRLRPGMYVGPTERLPPTDCWVLDPLPAPPPRELLRNHDPQNLLNYSPIPGTDPDTTDGSSVSKYRMTQREYGLVPALIKIFDETLVNASDNRLRHPESCTRIDVIIHRGSEERDPFIQVLNDGKGIPVHLHEEEGMYVPEMLFGHLLTGSNFDDSQKRVTGGRHGYGAKLTNIFSKSFTIETVDARRKLKYRQTWLNNMEEVAEEDPIEDLSGDKNLSDYTCVTFYPDLPRLTSDPDARSISEEDYAVMCRRVLDVAGCTDGKLRVTLNGVDVSLPSFIDYCKLYRSEGEGNAHDILSEKIGDRWTVGIGLSESGSFEAVSFVNGMSTSRGGTHLNAIVLQVIRCLMEQIAKTDPDLGALVTPGMVRRCLFVCCDALIENPSFDSQMKEHLTSNPKNFGSSCILSKKFLKSLVKREDAGGPGILEEILRVARSRLQANLLREVGGNKSKRQLLSISKLEDAHRAGTNKGLDCTLILTEGDSAKALAVAGLEVIGRDNFGVFPLRGKFLNVRSATLSQLAKNGEATALCSILGLDFDKEYDTVEERRSLRYGRVMLMTDQDNDGSHIKGLMINFFRHFWPKLLKAPIDEPPEVSAKNQPFLSSFVTPLLKANKKGTKETSLSFFSMAEYQAWRDSVDDDELKKWKVKYYKGLGTSTPAEAKEYFSDFYNHHRPFHWNSDIDGELLDMVFDKGRASERRTWILNEYEKNASISVDPDQGNTVSFEDFLNKEMIHFSHADNIRSIPSVIDGLKPSQRKVLYACFKRKLNDEIKVAQLSGYCAEHTAYHHGEASLQSTIIGMSQDFVGSNNLNLLVPSGQFGTRLAGGDDAASPRYIFTYLAPITRFLFPEIDDPILSYREDDGQIIEPEFYCPVIPLLLVNGSMGIGTGWSTFIPPHNPLDVLNYIRAKLEGEQVVEPIQPFVLGHRGALQWSGDGYVSYGRWRETTSTSIVIDELPFRSWTTAYKEKLLRMRDQGDISEIIEDHTTTEVSFTVKMKAAHLKKLKRKKLMEKSFNLERNVLTTNMHAFDTNNQMRKFDSAESIADAYFPVRMDLYRDRKSVLESEMNYSSTKLRNKARFVQAVTTGRVGFVSGLKSKEEAASELRTLGFATSNELKAIRRDNVVSARRHSDTGDEAADDSSSAGGSDFDYLLSMPLYSLTSDKIHELNKEASRKEEELNIIQSESAEDLWRNDLDKLEPQLEKLVKERSAVTSRAKKS